MKQLEWHRLGVWWLKKGKQTLHFLCFMSDINVLTKLFEKRGITFNSPLISASVEQISDNLLYAYLLNYFSLAEGVPKAIENTWKFVLFIVLYLILRFARSPAYHHTHTIDTYDYLCNGYFGYQCGIVEKSPREGSKMGGYALDLNK